MSRRSEKSEAVHFQAARWQCNCLLVERGGHALIIDPCWTPAEIAAIRASLTAKRHHLLVTHADCDHVCGVPYFPDAAVVMGARSVPRIDDGSAARELQAEAEAWGFSARSDLRVDVVVAPEDVLELGPFSVATIDTPGHAADGTAFVLRNEGVLAAGDYLSTYMSPLIWSSVSAAIKSNVRLLEALDRYDLETVMPGHGRLLSVGEARMIGAQDLAYLEAVERVADDAHRSKVSQREWLLAVQEVPLPRANATDIEIFCPRMLNAAATFRDRGRVPELPWTLSQ